MVVYKIVDGLIYEYAYV